MSEDYPKCYTMAEWKEKQRREEQHRLIEKEVDRYVYEKNLERTIAKQNKGAKNE